MSSSYVAERSDTAVPVHVSVSDGGPVTGLTAVVAVRDGNSDTSYLDFNDDTFKAAGHTTKFASMADIGNGRYALTGGLDLAGITNLPASTHNLVLEFDVTGSVCQSVDDNLELRASVYDIWSRIVDGTVTALTVLQRVNAWVRGRITVVGDDLTYYAEDNTTDLYTNRKGASERTPQ